MEEHQRLFKLASILLQYPEREWLEDEQLFYEISKLANHTARKRFLQFLDYAKTKAVDELCELYVRTFDLSDRTTMYLTYYLFGDQKERGQALLKLKEAFRRAGLELTEDELPDYLPLMLEFAAAAPVSDAKNVLLAHQRAIKGLADRLQEVNHPHFFVLDGCLAGMDAFLEEAKGVDIPIREEEAT
ncbi:nitrate reductase molybdenum cofactor assembly chaperone [Geobacillus thermoleovorans]|uniref:Nitrate reductase n=1 Tax=Geobacillus thermopakistaniensis (strain MAS1) TaxID=1408282 RepID=A0A7U9P6F1_GEOTM|nr:MULTISPECIES: nitrate reductase molybdenum cofactor assembly chaperone [Geobacillus]ESU72597.1 nitrate reductase [Geobacillus sp. MAS1]OQP20429.1 nitrate reductase molybdenum cofactor assembly chaperone [Geobacillus zalihae]PJW13216.1 nitrate reductase molybdenum cofactor assembly chaperone [Geobacillus sp. Manikaran-105]QNU24222.1 nitrate reductase molybdenum cofactor assembly chaperone [Geobacillus zalihae]TRY36473.1 nitrate reductase molybdenum cofactor assembly chaperone [Geobacillus sp